MYRECAGFGGDMRASINAIAHKLLIGQPSNCGFDGRTVVCDAELCACVASWAGLGVWHDHVLFLHVHATLCTKYFCWNFGKLY